MKFKLEFDLTPEWAAARWTGRCEISGLPFTSEKLQPLTPSIDKIDPHGGYTQTNCRFIGLALNRFKADFSDGAILEIARAIASYHEKVDASVALSLPA